jgi:hypothetical protein
LDYSLTGESLGRSITVIQSKRYLGFSCSAKFCDFARNSQGASRDRSPTRENEFVAPILALPLG